VVKDDVKRMDRLITDISNASRLDAELARNETVSVDLAKMLNELVRVVNDSAKKGEALVELQIQTPAQLPAGAKSKLETYIIRCHEMRLGQVMHNLIDNARSFSADGSSVTIRLRRLKDSVDVRIEDQGPGIRPENLERIFERFYTDRPTDSFGKNSGLGLAISRQIIEAHKGRIWAENRLVKDASAEDGSRIVGARFVIRLPSGADEGEP
jgi:two-component system, OmpR family, sensor histidine kinase ChvG